MPKSTRASANRLDVLCLHSSSRVRIPKSKCVIGVPRGNSSAAVLAILQTLDVVNLDAADPASTGILSLAYDADEVQHSFQHFILLTIIKQSNGSPVAKCTRQRVPCSLKISISSCPSIVRTFSSVFPLIRSCIRVKPVGGTACRSSFSWFNVNSISRFPGRTASLYRYEAPSKTPVSQPSGSVSPAC